MQAHLIFHVRDQSASRDFYRATLDQSPTLDVPGMTEFSLGAGAILGLMPLAGILRLLGDGLPERFGTAAGPPRAELYLVVEDAEVWHRRALAAGAVELSPMSLRDWGHRVAYSADPDGYVLAFAAE